MHLKHQELTRLNTLTDQAAIEHESLRELQTLTQKEIELIEGFKTLERDVETTIGKLTLRAEATFQDFCAEDYIPAAQLEDMINRLQEASENMALGLWIQRLEWGEGRIH